MTATGRTRLDFGERSDSRSATMRGILCLFKEPPDPRPIDARPQVPSSPELVDGDRMRQPRPRLAVPPGVGASGTPLESPPFMLPSHGLT